MDFDALIAVLQALLVLFVGWGGWISFRSWDLGSDIAAANEPATGKSPRAVSGMPAR